MKERLQKIYTHLRSWVCKPMVWLPLCAVTLIAAAVGVGLLAGGAAEPAAGPQDFRTAESTTAAPTTTTTAPRYTVRITADGETAAHTANEGTVADALAAAGVTLDEEDMVTPPAYAPISDGMEIAVTRVTYAERTETEIDACETVYRYSSLLAAGETTVHREGQDGVTEIVYRDRLEDGSVTASEKLSETVVQTREDRVVLLAAETGVPMSAAPYEILLDANGQPTEYTQKYTGSATAYTADRGLCGAYTASGRPVQVGVVSVNPNLIPYGTPMYIVSPDGGFVYGYAIAGDTGGAMLSGHTLVDLYMDTFEECAVFGRREMNVYILG